jgi:hypothetical protein
MPPNERPDVRFEPVPHVVVVERPAWATPSVTAVGLDAAQVAIGLLETRATSAEARIAAVEKAMTATVAAVAPLSERFGGNLMSVDQAMSLTQIEALLAAIAAAFKSFNPPTPVKPAA